MRKNTCLLVSVLFLLAGYGGFMTMRVHVLEIRLKKLEFAHRGAGSLSYSFDDSFMRHFGQQGVTAVREAITRGATTPPQVLSALNQDEGLRIKLGR